MGTRGRLPCLDALKPNSCHCQTCRRWRHTLQQSGRTSALCPPTMARCAWCRRPANESDRSTIRLWRRSAGFTPPCDHAPHHLCMLLNTPIIGLLQLLLMPDTRLACLLDWIAAHAYLARFNRQSRCSPMKGIAADLKYQVLPRWDAKSSMPTGSLQETRICCMRMITEELSPEPRLCKS